MIFLQCITISVLLCIVSTSPVSYQYVRFLRNGGTKADIPQRRSRSFRFSSKEVYSGRHFWDGDSDIIPHSNSLTFEEHRGHITPDFSNGLDYPDPFLLTGRAAKRAVSVLYRKPFFFGEINHVDALLRNQEERRRNGLAGNRLGSLRPQLPFYRFKQQYYDYFK